MSDSLESVKTLKVGGVKALPIALALGSGIVLFAIFERGKTAPSDPVTDTPTGDADPYPQIENPSFQAMPVVINQSDTVPPTPEPNETNYTWSKRAVSWLVASGYTYDASQSAITAYLNGESLTMDQGTLRDKAIAQFGQPPEDFVYGGTQGYSGPASAQGTPPCTHTVKGASDDTPTELARLYYGSVNSDAVRTILASNTRLESPYPSGSKISIPQLVNPVYYKATSATRTAYAIAAKNSTTVDVIEALNPSVKFPVKPHTRVRVK